MDEFSKYYTLSLRYLTYRSRSTKEIQDYLLKKKVPQDIIQRIIDILLEQKFLDDVLFAKQWIESRSKYRQRGLKVIKMELRRKGITDDLIEEALCSLDGVKEDETIARIVEKKIGKYKGLSRAEIFEKLGSHLLRRGFEYDDVKHAIDEALKKGV